MGLLKTVLTAECQFSDKKLNATSFSNTVTHLFPMRPFSTLWKHQRTVRLSDIFRE